MTDETETSGSGTSSESGATTPETTTPAAPENPTTGGQEQPASPDAPETAPVVVSNRQEPTTADLRYMVGVIITDLEYFFDALRKSKTAQGVDSAFLTELSIGRAAVLKFFTWLKNHV